LAKCDNQLPGLDLRFYSNDHDPEHFHATKKGAWEIKVFFRTTTSKSLDFELKWAIKSTGPSSTEQKKLRDYVETNRATLEEEWESKVCQL
jgi:hypothetical protein